jgi:hypothetical protein
MPIKNMNMIAIKIIGIILPNVQDEPRPQLARSVRLGARSVTAVVVGSGAWLGSVVFISEIEAEACPRAWFDFVETEERPLGKTNPSLFREICLLVLR